MKRLILPVTGLMALLLALATLLQAAPPEFQGRDLDGRVHTLDDYAGKMVLVNYWATWCPPCREEMPELAVFHEAYKDSRAVVLGVNSEDIEEAALRVFLDEQMIDFPIIAEKPAANTPFGVLRGLPTSYLVAADRSKVITHIGPLDHAQLEKYLQQLAPASKPAVPQLKTAAN